MQKHLLERETSQPCQPVPADVPHAGQPAGGLPSRLAAAGALPGGSLQLCWMGFGIGLSAAPACMAAWAKARAQVAAKTGISSGWQHTAAN